MFSRITHAVTLGAVSVLAVFCAYADTLHQGFRWDDYHFQRVLSAGEIWRVWHGTWDPSGIEAPFYRPLTAWLFSLRFAAFGWHAQPQHAVSMILFAICAWLFGALIRRYTHDPSLAVLSTVLYAVYPTFVYAQGAWLTNQMHLIASMLVLTALLVWPSTAPSRAQWAAIVGLQVVAFLIKEDTILLLPMLLAITWARMRIVGDADRPTWGATAGTAALTVALVCIRQAALGQVGGYRTPSLSRALVNLVLGPLSTFALLPFAHQGQAAAVLLIVVLITTGAIVAAISKNSSARWMIAAGLIIVALFNLPFVLTAKAEQDHLIALGAVLCLVGAVLAWVDLSHTAIQRLAALAVPWTLCILLLSVTVQIVQEFAPCAPETLRTDRLAAEWHALAPEIRAWLRRKPTACASGLTPIEPPIK